MSFPSTLAIAAGALTWTASEYCLHRWVGHGPKRKRQPGIARMFTPMGFAEAFNEEHLAHHTDPMYFAPTSHKIAAVSFAAVAVSAGASCLFGPRRGLSYALGFALTYAGYEVLHRRIHTHPPKGPYGRWLRRHHLLHHYRSPRANHGVTTPLWDHVFSTLIPSDKATVRVQRRTAPAWMVDPNTQEIRPEFSDTYELVGSARSAGETARRTESSHQTLSTTG
jgi:hypothetical protein